MKLVLSFQLRLFLLVILSAAITQAQKIALPQDGAFMGAYVDAGGLSDEVRPHEVKAFETLIGRSLSWIYFSNNWLNGQITFPKRNVEICRELGRTPYIRLMPWSEVSSQGAFDPHFTMDAFLVGKFDSQLSAWARQAKAHPGPYIFEFGPEVNGSWFPWNGKWNGGGVARQYGDPRFPDGPEKFRDAYRRVIELFRKEGLTEVTWVFHVDTAKSPHASWNQAEYYYPGDEYIDWIGLSVFGAQLPTHEWIEFLPKLKAFWPEIASIAKRKPVIISEFAVIEDKRNPNRKAQWIQRALRTIETGLYPIKGITYWNSPGWLEDGSADFRITSSQQALNTFTNRVTSDFWKTLKIDTKEELK